MQKPKRKLPSVSKLLLAVLVVSVLAVYLSYSQNSRQDETEKVSGQTPAAETADEFKVERLEDAGDTMIAEEERKVSVFIDKDNDMTWDGTEKPCETCILKTLLGGEVQNSLFPKPDAIREFEIASQGVIVSQELGLINTVWGYFEDRGILVEPQIIAFNDGSSDIHLYARETAATVSGVNANISRITNSGSQQDGIRVVYGFSELIPSFQQAANNSLPVWVQFVPDLSAPVKYYLAKGLLKKDANGSLSGSSSGYYLELTWPLGVSNPGLESKDHLKLFLL
jgi:hypothetical protein